jgi:PAS domain-containing protein
VLIALLIYVLGRNALMNYLIFAPLSSLTESVSKAEADLFGSGRDDEIGELAQTIREMRNGLNEAHERALLMLDATPLACRLWNRNYEIFECNDEAVKLFRMKDKQENMERHFDLSPEYQSDGQNSRQKTYKTLEKVFREGRYVFEWVHQLLDGTLIPVEITLVRVKYGNEDVIAGYTRDLREQKLMMDEIERRDNLLHIVNTTATVLLSPMDEENFVSSLQEGLEIIVQYVDVDRSNIWRNEMIDGVFCYVNQFQWLRSDVTRKGSPAIAMRPYREMPEWERKFFKNEYINGPVSTRTQDEQAILEPQGVKSS